jgi:hypothetical protein
MTVSTSIVLSKSDGKVPVKSRNVNFITVIFWLRREGTLSIMRGLDPDTTVVTILSK